MRVNDQVRKCVAFVGYQDASGKYQFAGSAFWLGRDASGAEKAKSAVLVTARHVIDGIRGLGLDEVWLRLNRSDGTSKWFSSQLADWVVHPTDKSIDVALLPAGIPADCDHLIFPLSRCVTPEVMQDNEVGLGDEVFIVGLFRHHSGSRRNIPIVRVGNLALLGEERIVTAGFGEMDANLIEARSIGGLSGSAVFLNLGSIRKLGGQLKIGTSEIFYLFGLIHGHYDASSTAVDSTESDGGVSTERVNTGIAIVVPFRSIQAVYDHWESRRAS